MLVKLWQPDTISAESIPLQVTGSSYAVDPPVHRNLSGKTSKAPLHLGSVVLSRSTPCSPDTPFQPTRADPDQPGSGRSLSPLFESDPLTSEPPGEPFLAGEGLRRPNTGPLVPGPEVTVIQLELSRTQDVWEQKRGGKEDQGLFKKLQRSDSGPKMSDLSQVAVYSDSSDIYKNVFCNPAFELEGEREERVEGFRTSSSTPEPIKPPAASELGSVGVCAMRLRGPGCGWGVAVSAAALLLVTALGLALALLLTQIKGQAVENELMSTTSPNRLNTGYEAPHITLPTISSNTSQQESTTAPQPARIPPPETRCGGVLSDSEGSFSTPNHPGSYPPNLLCVWVIRVPPSSVVQIHISSLTVEGPSPCLFDWLEVQEQRDQSSVVTRFCGNVAPPTVNTNSSTVWVTFHSDGSIAGSGFTAQYRAIQPGHKSCSREEFMCDRGRCLLPVSICDGHINCHDQTDEANCSHKHKGESMQTKNVEGQKPGHMLCVWYISVEEGHVITLSFRNFSLETQDVCEFDYLEVHDSINTGSGRVLGR
ncbi:hypothetical protein F7725_020912 [Dissostichus mawsoni]|uniref:CUB domain-containing protein n=1 Tax=Dissostichus mawsoni TaxID=36200 RepID=A0A7J5YEJ6_DISMA|nr:hypothetical protein F7725_020912 [Dissostichus mawsoni]